MGCENINYKPNVRPGRDDATGLLTGDDIVPDAYIFLVRRRESIEINITDERINSVPNQSGRVNVMPSNNKESSALLSGSAQLNILAFGPPINCAPFRYRLNVSDVPMTTR